MDYPRLVGITLSCFSCRNKRVIDCAAIEKLIRTPFTEGSLSERYTKFFCTKCGEKNYAIYDQYNKMMYRFQKFRNETKTIDISNTIVSNRSQKPEVEAKPLDISNTIVSTNNRRFCQKCNEAAEWRQDSYLGLIYYACPKCEYPMF